MEVDVIMNLVKEWWGTGVAALVVIGYFVEVSKIKINPLSFILTRLGNAFNKPTLDLMKEHEKSNRMEMDAFLHSLKDIQKEQTHISRKVDVNEAKRLRKEIMDFAAAVRRREYKSEESYKNIICAHDEYHKLIESTGITNGVVDEDYAFIVKVYRNCSVTGQFDRKKCYENMEDTQ